MNSIKIPQRGFSPKEFETRVERAKDIMRKHRFDALLVSSPPNVRYFTGFDSQFWESPTRPWFVVVPLETATSGRTLLSVRRLLDDGHAAKPAYLHRVKVAMIA